MRVKSDIEKLQILEAQEQLPNLTATQKQIMKRQKHDLIYNVRKTKEQNK